MCCMFDLRKSRWIYNFGHRSVALSIREDEGVQINIVAENAVSVSLKIITTALRPFKKRVPPNSKTVPKHTVRQSYIKVQKRQKTIQANCALLNSEFLRLCNISNGYWIRR